MDRKRARRVLEILRRGYPPRYSFLSFENPFELLVAVVLSAQCTDGQVNRVTPRLFSRFKTPAELAEADPHEVEKIVRPTGFFHVKARRIQEIARFLLSHSGGEVPRTLKELLLLPGVGRKTANVVLTNAFGIVEGIPVDTHVARLSRRIGLSSGRSPEAIERDLMELFPKKDWADLSYLLIQHGRAVCKARNPQCGRCSLRRLCPRIGVEGGGIPK